MRVLNEVEHRRGIPRYEVLLISNDLPTIRIIKSYFDSKMFKFKDVSSCTQALEELESQTPMLILLDRTLPEENRIQILKRIKNDKKLRKVSTKTFTKNEYKLQKTKKKKKESQIYKGDELIQKIKINYPQEDLIKLQRSINSHSPTAAGKFAEFKINQYITLKLKLGKTFIYVDGKRFLQCIRLALNIQKSNTQMYDEINSIDEAADLYAKQIFQNRIIPEVRAITSQGYEITAEQEFWGHCSNIQAWVEHYYDTRILKSNVSFPLLRQLAQVGDLLAKKVFKEEIALRIEDGNQAVVQYLINEGYLRYLAPSEIKTIIENTKLIENLSFNRNQLNSIKEALRNHPKQTDLQEREVIEEIINTINAKIAKDGYKVIVIGDREVGKTELLTKYATNISGKDLMPSIGVQFFKKQVELKDHNVTVNLMFWDIAAQQFSSLRSLYFEGADVILLVFNISRGNNLSNVINWFSYNPDGVPRILIGNSVNPEDERKITFSRAKKLSEEINAQYFETSIAVGENINLIFHTIAELIYETKELEAKELNDSKDLGEIIFKFHEDNLNEAKKTRK